MSMTSPLIPLASNDLFDGGPTSEVTRQRLQVAPSFKQPGNQPAFMATSFNPAAARERRESPHIQRPPSSRKLNHATSPTRNCFASRAGDDQAVKCFCPMSRRTVELTRRRESKHAPPHQASYETRSRRSRPTICSTAVQPPK